MRRKGLSIVLVSMLSAAVLLAGCSSQPGSSPDPSSSAAPTVSVSPAASTAPSASASQKLSIVTGGTGGTYYPLGGQIANIINNKTGHKATAQASGASVENMKLIHSKDADFAFTQTDIAAYATGGTEMFKNGGALKNIAGIGTLYPETVQIVTLKSSGLRRVEDLSGKRVSVGAPGSGTYANAEQILAIHGITMNDIKAQHLSFDESTDGIKDGNIDAAFITAGTPTGAVDGLSVVKPVTIISISDAKINELVAKHPYYAKDVIKSGTYKLDQDVNTVAVLAMLVARADLSDEVVYETTKAVFENTKDIGHAKGAMIKAETALQGMGIPLHPGAKKYFDEKRIK